MSNIILTIELDQRQANAFLRWVVAQYEVAMADVWHADAFRFIPKAERTRQVFKHYPHIAALGRTGRELTKQLGEQERAR